MRSRLLAIALAGGLALFAAVPTASAQHPNPCAFGAIVPFSIPQMGVDPLGRPFAIQINGVYGPYDGFGYPLRFDSIGFVGGRPYARAVVSYVPAPCPPSLPPVERPTFDAVRV
jgi:hypothetical protein